MIASATASEEERRFATDALWSSRHAIEAENSSTSSAHILKHLRLGGWGGLHLSARPASMPFLSDPAGRLVDPDDIKILAHRHYAELFEAPPQKFLAEDAELARLLDR